LSKPQPLVIGNCNHKSIRSRNIRTVHSVHSKQWKHSDYFKQLNCLCRQLILNLQRIAIGVHTRIIQFLAIFYNLAANEQGILPKTSKILINTPK